MKPRVWHRFYDEGVPAALDFEERPLPSFLERSAREHADAPAVLFPDEVDAVLTAHPAVREAATIGVPDPRRGETVRSFVVLREGQTATADDLVAYCRRELAAYKVPRSIEFLDELPKNAAQKVLRRELRERAAAAGARTS